MVAAQVAIVRPKETSQIMIDRIAIAGYRSIRSIILRLGQLNVVTGANGSGKSNLYRALRLIADSADGRLAESLAREGGFDSVRWAGPKKSSKDPVSLRLGFTADPLSYCFDLGLPQPSESMFDGDPEMKRECLWRGVLIPALARLIALGCENIQIIVVSHNVKLVEELEADEICVPIRLEKEAGETVLQDDEGWLDITSLIEAANQRGKQLSLELLHEVVATNDKQRFALSDDGLRIRANQGHSVTGVDLKLAETTPPATLYHGTVAVFIDSIRSAGLHKRSRNHVHLSADELTATKVGSRRGRPIILRIDAEAMHHDGHRFFLSVNEVWLVEVVPPSYLTIPD